MLKLFFNQYNVGLDIKVNGVIHGIENIDLERMEVIFESPLYFDYDNKVKDEQIYDLGINIDVISIGAIHENVGVISGHHVLNPFFKTRKQNEALYHKVIIYLKPSFFYSYSEPVVQDETLHHKVMVMLVSHLSNCQSKTYDIPSEKTFPMGYNY